MQNFDQFIKIVGNMTIINIIDILIIAYIFYKIYKLIEETRAIQLFKGIAVVGILIPISSMLNLTLLNWILESVFTIGVLSIVIIFQPEIRRALEKLGTTTFVDKSRMTEEAREELVTNIITAVETLSEKRIGALIVLEQKTALGEYIKTGVNIDAETSSSLLETIFNVKAPLHDGACIIRNDRIVAAGCFLPLSSNFSISKKLGTRHRAGIGITENSDAVSIIVSEETGEISLAVKGRLLKGYSPQKLSEVMSKILTHRSGKKMGKKEKIMGWIEKRWKTKT